MTQLAVGFDEYLTLPCDPNPWLLKPIIPVGGLAQLYGAPKTLKSFMALQLARSLAEGSAFLGLPPARERVKVLYIQLDTPRSIWQDRIHKLLAAGEEFSAQARANIKLADPEQCPYPFDILAPAGFDYLKQNVSEHQPDLVIIDTLRKMFKGNEDKSEVMNQVMSTLRLACRPAAVLFVSHARKANPEYDGGVIEEGRGSGAVSGDADTIMRLTKASKTGKKPAKLAWQGRATEDTELSIQLKPSLFFELLSAPAPKDKIDQYLHEVLNDPDLKSTYAKAKTLASLSGENFEKCRARLGRVEV